MKRNDKKWLTDIYQAILKTNSFLEATTSFFDYEKNDLLKSAVERQIGIIGEAMNKLRNEYPEIKIENANQIIGLRNRIIHAYDAIDNTVIWGIYKKHLPHLKSEIESLLLN